MYSPTARSAVTNVDAEFRVAEATGVTSNPTTLRMVRVDEYGAFVNANVKLMVWKFGILSLNSAFVEFEVVKGVTVEGKMLVRES